MRIEPMEPTSLALAARAVQRAAEAAGHGLRPCGRLQLDT
jgi:hypothetical protein